jgi:hypothetical protein
MDVGVYKGEGGRYCIAEGRANKQDFNWRYGRLL